MTVRSTRKKAAPPVAVVAGASRGLGLLMARELGRHGYQVVICARTAEELERARAILYRRRAKVHTRVCDVGDQVAVQEMVADVESQIGAIAVLISVAGIIQVGPLASLDAANFRTCIDTMLWGPINLSLSVLPAMRERGAGRIGIVTSIGGIVSVPHLLPYSTAKFGAVGFAEGLQAELAGSGVTATTLVPGLMRTGSHLNAQFAGQQSREYAWFGLAASLPLISIDAKRAARRMVKGVLAGKPIVIVTPLAKLAIRLQGLAPGLMIRLLGATQRLLPNAPAGRPAGEIITGHAAAQDLDSWWHRRLTRLGSKAARRLNQTKRR